MKTVQSSCPSSSSAVALDWEAIIAVLSMSTVRVGDVSLPSRPGLDEPAADPRASSPLRCRCHATVTPRSSESERARPGPVGPWHGGGAYPEVVAQLVHGDRWGGERAPVPLPPPRHPAVLPRPAGPPPGHSLPPPRGRRPLAPVVRHARVGPTAAHGVNGKPSVSTRMKNTDAPPISGAPCTRQSCIWCRTHLLQRPGSPSSLPPTAAPLTRVPALIRCPSPLSPFGTRAEHGADARSTSVGGGGRRASGAGTMASAGSLPCHAQSPSADSAAYGVQTSRGPVGASRVPVLAPFPPPFTARACSAPPRRHDRQAQAAVLVVGHVETPHRGAIQAVDVHHQGIDRPVCRSRRMSACAAREH
jgi:hypothetical protein